MSTGGRGPSRAGSKRCNRCKGDPYQRDHRDSRDAHNRDNRCNRDKRRRRVRTPPRAGVRGRVHGFAGMDVLRGCVLALAEPRALLRCER